LLDDPLNVPMKDLDEAFVKSKLKIKEYVCFNVLTDFLSAKFGRMARNKARKM